MTPEELKAYLTDPSRFPKKNRAEVIDKQYQVSAEEFNGVVEILKHLPIPVFMSQSEFDRITNDGTNLEPIKDIEDLRVYEDDETPTEGGGARYENGVLTIVGTLEGGTLTIVGTLDNGVLTI